MKPCSHVNLLLSILCVSLLVTPFLCGHPLRRNPLVLDSSFQNDVFFFVNILFIYFFIVTELLVLWLVQKIIGVRENFMMLWSCRYFQSRLFYEMDLSENAFFSLHMCLNYNNYACIYKQACFNSYFLYLLPLVCDIKNAAYSSSVFLYPLT